MARQKHYILSIETYFLLLRRDVTCGKDLELIIRRERNISGVWKLFSSCGPFCIVLMVGTALKAAKTSDR